MFQGRRGRSNGADADGDGVPDACDPGRSEEVTTFRWVTWSPGASTHRITGTVGGVGVTCVSSHSLETTTSVYQHATFPPRFGVPNVNPAGTTDDTDGDGAPDVCDRCPAHNPDDPDGDGVCGAP